MAASIKFGRPALGQALELGSYGAASLQNGKHCVPNFTQCTQLQGVALVPTCKLVSV